MAKKAAAEPAEPAKSSPELTRAFMDYMHMQMGLESAQRNAGRATASMHKAARALGWEGLGYVVRWDDKLQEAVVEKESAP